jgi:hypothetical protein
MIAPLFAVRGPINVQMVGAKGDGITDDAPAFRQAASVAQTFNPPAPIYIPPGRYLFGSSIPTDATSGDGSVAAVIGPGTRVYGVGAASTIEWRGGSARPMGFSAGLDPMPFSLFQLRGSNICISNIRFHGENGDSNGVGYTQSENYQHAAVSVYAKIGSPEAFQNIEISNCIFENLYGFSAQNGGNSKGLYFRNNVCRYTGNGANINGDDSEYSGNVFHSAEGIEWTGRGLRAFNNKFSGVSALISATGSVGGQNHDISIYGNIFDLSACADTNAMAIIIGDADGANVSNNIIQNPGLIGIYVLGTDFRCSKILLHGNSIYYDSNFHPAPGTADGIRAKRADFLTVSGNHIFGVNSGHAVLLDDINRAMLLGNTLRCPLDVKTTATCGGLALPANLNDWLTTEIS